MSMHALLSVVALNVRSAGIVRCWSVLDSSHLMPHSDPGAAVHHVLALTPAPKLGSVVVLTTYHTSYVACANVTVIGFVT